MSVGLIDVSHRYGTDRPVLKDVTVHFEPGTLVAVVGPSGSGKSTLLAIAGLLVSPWRGNVSYGGERIEWRHLRPPIDRSRIAWVFQNSNLFPRRTVLENTMMGSLANGLPIGEARNVSIDALERVEIRHLAKVQVRFISGGEAQRVGIARALASRSKYLFADEPTGQLDTVTTSIVLSALGSRRSEGLVTVIATHDRVVSESCDYIYNVADGVVSLKT